MANDGKDYEKFVAQLQQALLDVEDFTTQKNITIERNKKILDNAGMEREFDLYWEYELGGLIYKTVIECKDYASSVSVEKIDALIGKITDIPDLKGVFATKKGYQSGAKLKAQQNKIELLIVREQNETDWVDNEGNPLIREININFVAQPAPLITKFDTVLDIEWAEQNPNIDLTQLPKLVARNDEIFINDLEASDRYSLFDLAHRLSPIGDKEFGDFKKVEKLKNAFIQSNGHNLKIAGYKIEYSISRPAEWPIHLDFSKELIGVIEYLQRGTKKSIFNGGIVKEL